MKLRLGTRGSRLALTQSGHVAQALRAQGHEVDLVRISTLGDQVTDRPFAAIGPPGVFVREIETALLEERIDLAVHSYKDLPTSSPPGLVVAAVPPRVDPADVLLVDVDTWVDEPGLPLREGVIVGTSSARRTALVRDLRPDLVIEGIRGNVPTRMRTCREGAFAAIVLAAAGIERLRSDGLDLIQGQRLLRLPPSSFVPAPSQGALGLQVKAGSAAQQAVAGLNDPDSEEAVTAERAVLEALEGGCDAAIGAWCVRRGAQWVLHAALGTDGGLRRASSRSDSAMGCVSAVLAELRS